MPQIGLNAAKIRSLLQDAGCRMQDAWICMQDEKCCMQKAACCLKPYAARQPGKDKDCDPPQSLGASGQTPARGTAFNTPGPARAAAQPPALSDCCSAPPASLRTLQLTHPAVHALRSASPPTDTALPFGIFLPAEALSCLPAAASCRVFSAKNMHFLFSPPLFY